MMCGQMKIMKMNRLGLSIIFFPFLFFCFLDQPAYAEKSKPPSNNVLVLLDVSESMLIMDYRPDRISFAFNSVVTEISRWTNNMEFYGFSSGIKTWDFNGEIQDNIRQDGTSFNSTLLDADSILQKVSDQSLIVLITDGNTTDSIGISQDLLDRFRGDQIKVFCLGLGSNGRVQFGIDFFGRPRYLNDTYDPTILKEISNQTDGKYFYLPKKNRKLMKVLKELRRELNSD